MTASLRRRVALRRLGGVARLAVLGLLAPALAACGGSVDLTYRGTPGEVRKWKRTTLMEGTHPSGERSYIRTELYTEETVLEANREEHVVRVRFARTTVEGKRDGIPEARRFDSRDPATAALAFATEKGVGFGALAGVLSRLAGGSVVAHVRRDGILAKFGEIDALRDRMTDGLTDENLRRAASAGAEPALLRFHLQPPCKVLLRGATVGEEWDFKEIRPGLAETAGIPFQMYVLAKQRLAAMDGDEARLVLDGIVTLDPPSGAPPPPEALVRFRPWLRLEKGTFRGEVRMDTATGVPVSATVVTDLDLVATSARPGGPPGADGTPAPAPPEVRIPQRLTQTLERWDGK